tara:strand:- start:46 stop:750 length:705 start_codon:yes stop_codon:yes gene_type:complete
MSIIVKDVSKHYLNKKAIDNVSLNVKKGEILGILGLNGAGKSTLIKMICGLLEQSSGTIKILNIDTKEHNIDIKKKIGYLSESNPLYENMYILEYLNFISSFYDIDNPKKRINELVEKIKLKEEFGKKIKNLSKGYKQRVGLAAALIHDPEILILDEPSTGLDPKQIIEIRNLLKGLSKNKIILISTHIMQEVKNICSRFIIIEKGKIIADKLTSKENGVDELEEYFKKAAKQN